jgi:hypothetical protein
MKAESIVTIGANNATCGIIYATKNPSLLIFVVDKYFDDFKTAFNNYYNDLLGTANKPLASELQGKFNNAIIGMSVRLKFSSSSGLIGQSGAGIYIPPP